MLFSGIFSVEKIYLFDLSDIESEIDKFSRFVYFGGGSFLGFGSVFHFLYDNLLKI